MKGDRLVKYAVERQFMNNQPDNMFHDVPSHYTLEQVKYVVSHRKLWKRLAETIGKTGAPTKLWSPNPPPLVSPTPTMTNTTTNTNEITVRPPSNTMQQYLARDAHDIESGSFKL